VPFKSVCVYINTDTTPRNSVEQKTCKQNWEDKKVFFLKPHVPSQCLYVCVCACVCMYVCVCVCVCARVHIRVHEGPVYVSVCCEFIKVWKECIMFNLSFYVSVSVFLFLCLCFYFCVSVFQCFSIVFICYLFSFAQHGFEPCFVRRIYYYYYYYHHHHHQVPVRGTFSWRQSHGSKLYSTWIELLCCSGTLRHHVTTRGVTWPHAAEEHVLSPVNTTPRYARLHVCAIKSRRNLCVCYWSKDRKSLWTHFWWKLE